MPSTRSRCSICRHPDRPQINAALDFGCTYRWIVPRYGVSLGALSRHANHRASRRASAEGQPLEQVEQRLGQLEEEVALHRLLLGTELRLDRGARANVAELEGEDDDDLPF